MGIYEFRPEEIGLAMPIPSDMYILTTSTTDPSPGFGGGRIIEKMGTLGLRSLSNPFFLPYFLLPWKRSEDKRREVSNYSYIIAQMF